MHSRAAVVFPCLAALLTLSLPAGPAVAAWPNSYVDAVEISNQSGLQEKPVIISDGAGGAIIAFVQLIGSTGIYAQRLAADGSTGGGSWGPSGANMGSPGPVDNPVICSDGAGGAIIAWEDSRFGVNQRIFAQRVLANGTIAPGWPPTGLQVITNTTRQIFPRIVPDGSNGAILVWEDFRLGPGNTDIYAQRVNGSGVRQWGLTGIGIFTDPFSSPGSPGLISDGAGGVVVAIGGITALRIDGSGNPAPGWSFGGVSLSFSSPPTQWDFAEDGTGGAVFAGICFGAVEVARLQGDSYGPWGYTALGTYGTSIDQVSVVGDGTGGMVMAMHWFPAAGPQIMLARIGPGGTLGVPGWYNTVQVASSTPQNGIRIISNGSGGALVAWSALWSNTPYFDVFANQVTGHGALASGWIPLGSPVSLAPLAQYRPAMASDGRGGAIVAWQTQTPASGDRIHAQRIERYGQLGFPEPEIESIRDVRNDQGGKVQIRWQRSYLDELPELRIGKYWVWRQVPGLTAQMAAARGAVVARAGTASENLEALRSEATKAGRPFLQAEVLANQTIYWEWVAEQGAVGETAYSYTASTTSDSTGGSNAYTIFRIDALDRTSGSVAFWTSPADSGYSVDNIAPMVPEPFLGNYNPGATTLHWGANSEEDFSVYRLYRGTSSGFVPGPGNFVAEQSDTGYVDAAGAYYYKLAAVDAHGNTSPYALLTPPSTTGAGGGGAGPFAFAQPWPNPALDLASVQLTLPREGAIAINVYDHRGRLVRRLAGGVMPAGGHTLRWDLRDGTGRDVANGMYLISTEWEGRRTTRRVAVLR